MTLFAVVDETSLETGLDAGDDAFVDVAFALFAAGDFNIQIDQFLTVNDCHAQFFLVRGVKQHALHEKVLRLMARRKIDAQPWASWLR